MIWETTAFLSALTGGALIGLSVTLMLLFNGRVTGISGIIASSVGDFSKSGLWRWFFLIGLLTGGGLAYLMQPELFVNETGRNPVVVAIAGLLVGYGTLLGSGCTSGHGICGISRLSPRSLLATMSFMASGFATVQVARWLLGDS